MRPNQACRAAPARWWLALAALLAFGTACGSELERDAVADTPGAEAAPTALPQEPPAGEPPADQSLPGLPGGEASTSTSPSGDPAAVDGGRMVSTGDSEGLSADMLSADEAAQAAESALESLGDLVAAATDRDAVSVAEVNSLADQPNYRVMYTQRAPAKDAPARSAEVAVYRYDTNETVIRQVDLASGAVTEIEVPPGYAPPLLPREIQEAARIARLDPDARSALENAGLDPDTASANGLLTGLQFESTHACAAHRCVRIFFHEAARPVPTFSVVVDLSAFAVVEVSDMQEEE
jgi:hypothetical protein